MFYSYFYSLLRAGYVIIPVQSVSDFVDFCNAAGRFVCGGAFTEDGKGQVIYL